MRSIFIVSSLIGCMVSSAAIAQSDSDSADDDIVVTATGRAESRDRIPSTVEVIDRETIDRSTAKSLTDLLAENAVAFLSEWTPAQTSINIRGGASDGQGRDFKGQVLVLVNGRRAGTANMSKLSPGDVERIEVVRGAASVIYGSQNMGGVINIITRDGRSQQGVRAELRGGSWGLWKGTASIGGASGAFDWYLGGEIGTRNDYHGGHGAGTQQNTSWDRRGISGALGWQIAPDHRLELSARTDGIYDAGFRGSGGNIHSKDTRTNASADLVYTGKFGVLSIEDHVYGVSDIDNLKWASPVVKSGVNPVPGTSKDWNRRRLAIVGNRFQPRVSPFTGNDLLLGWDYEYSQLRSTRVREPVAGATVSQLAPYDNNQTENVHAIYFEDAQSLLDNRLTLRGGLRQTWGSTRFDKTPNVAMLVVNTRHYDALTYSAGATLAAAKGLVLRAGISSGFRAPTASELAADFTAVGGGRVFGNADLKPERSRQLEAGVAWSGAGSHVDLALFENRIKNRIITVARAEGTNTSDYANNSADIVIRGVELQASTDLLSALGVARKGWSWKLSGGGSYNFHMKDNGAASTRNTDKPERIYQYQASISTTLRRSEVQMPWSIGAVAVLRGPVWYNTEENLLIPKGEPNSSYVHRKSPFWQVNLTGDVDVMREVTVFAAVNNLFNVNQHPLFIAIDNGADIADLRFFNGSGGTSMPGRNVEFGLRVRF